MNRTRYSHKKNKQHTEKADLKMRPVGIAVRASILSIGMVLGAAHAADISVTSNLDDNGNGCTLREAIASANSDVDLRNGCAVGSAAGADRILFDTNAFAGSNDIYLNNGQLTLTNKNIVMSAGSGEQGITLTAGESARVMRVSGGNIVLNNITLTGGNLEDGGATGERGGGLLIDSTATVELRNSQVTNNTATEMGGGIRIEDDSSLTLENSMVTNNRVEQRSTVRGGGISAGNRNHLVINNSKIEANSVYSQTGSLSAGLIAENDNTVTITNSSISNNYGGGLRVEMGTKLALMNSRVENNRLGAGGALIGVAGVEISQTQDVMIVGSSIANNVGSSSVPGLRIRYASASIIDSTISGNYLNNIASSDGGGFTFESATVTFKNSTISSNRVAGSNGYAGGLIYGSEVSFENVTVANNILESADNTGAAGLFIVGSSISFANSVLADSRNLGQVSSTAPQCQALSSSNIALQSTITIDSATIIEDGGCGALRTDDPALLPLADNGGPTLTHALAENSLAIDSGVVATCLATDQRGFLRDASCDVGAFEFGAVARALTLSVSPPTIAENNGVSTGTITREGPTTEVVIISLQSSDLTTATVPGTVVIPAGQASANFAISAVDDLIADGDSTTTISASAIGFQPSAAQLTVQDNEVPALTLVLDQASIVENGSLNGTVSRNTPTTQALTVNLSSSNTGRARVSSSVVIPAGASSADFEVLGVDNLTVDASQIVRITASSIDNTLSGDSAALEVLDNDDNDNDTIANTQDNCPATPNSNQANLDGDQFGDVCDDDIDGDGMPNAFEQANFLNPRNAADANADNDGDGFSNIEEFRFGTDPNVADADDNGNGVPDAVEVNIAPILLLLLDE